MNIRTWSPLNRTFLLLGLLALGALVVVAVHDLALFELEGDAQDAALTPGDDWDKVLGYGAYSGNPSGGDQAHTFITDGIALSIYTTGGSKDDLDVSNWRHTDGNVPDKDEIVNAFAAAYVLGANVGSSQAGDLILYFGADRYANNGDSQIGFWFFKNEVFLGPGGLFVDGQGDPAQHAVGDLLILSDFTQGGRISTIKVYEWVGTGGDTNGTLDLMFTGTDCQNTGLSNDQSCATVNSIPQAAPWPYTPKFGSSGTFPTGSFYEGGVNLSRLARESQHAAPGCFGGFLAETRSSQSVDAQLKDFALGGFALCDARINIEPSATNEVRTQHEFTVTVEKKGPPNFSFGPASGVEVTATLEDGSVGEFVSGDNTCTTDADGECAVSITSEVAGTSTVSAAASITVDSVVFQVETDGEEGNSGPAVKTWVDAKISIGDSATNEVGAEHTFTVTLLENAGSGFGAAAGEHVDFSLTSHFGASCEVDEAASTCDDAGPNTDGSGQCTIVFSSSTTGQCVGSASSTLTVGGLSLFRETDGSYDNSGEATKTYVDASIAIDPPRGTNKVGDSHLFTVSVKADTGDDNGLQASNIPDGTLVTVSFSPSDPDSVTDNCGSTGTVNGVCTVEITHDAAAVFTAHASVSVDVGGLTLVRETDGQGHNSGDAEKAYVEAFITIEDDGANEVGDGHTFTVNVRVDAGSGEEPVADGTPVTVSFTPQDPGTVTDNCAAGTVSGMCTVEVNSSSAGTFTASASASVTLDGQTFELSTDGTGKNSGPATKVYADASIAISPENSTNPVGESHTFTVTVTADDGAGFGPAAVEGVNPIVSLSPTPDSLTDNCASSGTNASGQCTVVINHDEPEVFTANASITLSVSTTQGDVSISRDTAGNSGPDGSGPATKTYEAGRIIVVKETDPDGSPQSFSFSADYDLDGFSLTDGGSNNSGHLAPGTYSVSESVPAGWELTSATCDDGSDPSSIGLAAGETVTCTFVNTEQGRIIIEKQTDPDGSPQSFGFSADYDGDGFSLSDGGSNDSGYLAPASYLVSESVPAGWDLTSIECSGATNSVITVGDGAFFPSNSVNIELAAGETITCTFNNRGRGRIIVIKNAVPDDPQDFAFTAGGGLSPASFSLDDDANAVLSNTRTFDNLAPGSGYSLAETVPAGWDQTSATCSDSSPVNNINVSAGETVTCTFVNTKRGRIVVIKNAVPDDAQDFAFTAGGGLSPASFGLDDDADPGLSNTQNFDNVVPGSGYSIAETVPAGWDQTSATCSDSSPVNNIDVSPGETVTCTFVNTKRGTIIVEKQTNPDGAPGSFTFTGTAAGSLSDNGQITVANLVPGTYSSTEADPTPNFDLVSIVCNDSNSSGNVGTRTATFNLDPGETVKCTFTNRQRGMAKVIKTFLGSPPFGTLAFSFDLRQGATLTSLGTVLESGVANAANGGIINFSTKLVPGTTYQLCETGILPGWMTTLATLGAFVPGGSLPDPDNSTLCLNFSVNPGETKEFRIDNTPPPGGLAHTIGFWKNWTSCDGHGSQAPVLDQTLAAAGGGILIGDVFVDTCIEGIRLLDKSQISSGKKMASDPAYNLAAQLLAARLNIVAQAGSCSAANTAMAQAQALLDAINFTGNGAYRGSMSAAQRSAALNLAAILDSYNNNLLCFSF